MSYEENIILFNGVTFGILIMIIMYTFVRYLYSKELFYISYCLMQLFSMFYIIFNSKLYQTNLVFQELFQVVASLFALIFAINYYNGRFFPNIRNYQELILNTILFNIVIITVFYHYILFKYLPYSIIYLILFMSVIFNIKDGFKPTQIYVIGWSIVCMVIFFMGYSSNHLVFDYYDLSLLVFTFEAILFTISIAYKDDRLKKQNLEFEKMLMQQSKFVKSGEMIANISHQFRQPLNNISYILFNLKKRFENKKLDNYFFDKKINQANDQLSFLSKTINDFREFYLIDKDKKDFFIKDSIDNAIAILNADLKKENISLKINYLEKEDLKIFGVKNELSQVIISLVSNAIDALKNISNPKIDINIIPKGHNITIQVVDNGEGIKTKDIKKIFEPYYSTKENGMGIGLYLSKVIIEDSFNGTLQAQSNKNGAIFSILLK